MSVVHLHLLLNHVPVIGTFFVALVLAVAIWRRNDGMAKLGLFMTVAIGVVAAAVYFTGEPAEEAVEKLVGVADGMIHEHEEAAELAFIASSAAGLLSLALLAWWRGKQLPRSLASLVLVAVLAVAGLMARTSNLGGQIRHTEISGMASVGVETESDDH
jgi:hypothetical protein